MSVTDIFARLVALVALAPSWCADRMPMRWNLLMAALRPSQQRGHRVFPR
jgi:hypothetical protein